MHLYEKGKEMKGRVASLWMYLTILTIILWIFKGWTEQTGTMICVCLVVYYGENIIAKMEKKNDRS